MASDSKKTIVLLDQGRGITLIPEPTALTRLNYYDGKFLSAAALSSEQRYFKTLVEFANRAGGAGVVHGFDLTPLSGDRLRLAAGLAIDGEGRMLFLPEAVEVTAGDLIEQSTATADPGATPKTTGGAFAQCESAKAEPNGQTEAGAQLYLLGISLAEALCGQEDVYGKLCEQACVTGTERPYRLEGVRLQALPLQLSEPLAQFKGVGPIHLRSRVASAFFRGEGQATGHGVSASGFQPASPRWCAGAPALAGRFVPLAVLARAGASTLFLDEWTARRERIDPHPRHYWQWRMMMRPWNVFLAQILQFQCQLHGAGGGDAAPPADPCLDAAAVLSDLSPYLQKMIELYTQSGAGEDDLKKVAQIAACIQPEMIELQKRASGPGLIDRGIVELPPAGYLPVAAGSHLSINTQVRRLLGDGVDLRFCVVRPDFVAHALEEAQHLERISLVEGLEAPDRKPAVEILVPEGRFAPGAAERGLWYEMGFQVEVTDEAIQPPANGTTGATTINTETLNTAASAASADTLTELSFLSRPTIRVEVNGAARGCERPGGGLGFYFAGERPQKERRTVTASQPQLELLHRSSLRINSAGPDFGTLLATADQSGAWLAFEIDTDPALLAEGCSTRVRAELSLALSFDQQGAAPRYIAGRARFDGEFLVEGVESSAAELRITGTLAGQASAQTLQNQGILDISEAVTFTRACGPSGGDWLIEMANPQFGPLALQLLALERRWISSASARMAGTVTLAESPAAGHLDAQQSVNKQVADPTHPAHVVAIDALRLIARATANPGFLGSAGKLLFPPPDSSDERAVLGTLDWVLFHRRRDRDCGESGATAISRRRFALYRIALGEKVELERAITALRENDTTAIAALKPQFIQALEFDAGLPSLATPSSQLRASWRQALGSEAAAISGAVVAARGPAAAEGEQLSEARAESVVTALAKEAPQADPFGLVVLERVPDHFAAADLDGVLLLGTVGQWECQTVMVLNSDSSQLELLLQHASSGAALTTELKRLGAEPLGAVRFAAGSGQAHPEDLAKFAKQWEEGGWQPPAEALVVCKKGDGSAEQEAGRAQTLAKTLGAEVTPKWVECPDPPGGECTVLTVLTVIKQVPK